MALITVEQTEAFITVAVTVEASAERHPGQKAAAAARKVADGKIWRASATRVLIDGIVIHTFTYVREPSKAMLSERRAQLADIELAKRVRAEVEREWEKIERLGGGRHTTAWHLIGSAEENADDTAAEEGFERHSDQWYSILWSSYRLEEEYSQYGQLAYTRNIEDDITDGLIEAL